MVATVRLRSASVEITSAILDLIRIQFQPWEAPSDKNVGIVLHLQSYRRAPYPRIVPYTRTHAYY